MFLIILYNILIHRSVSGADTKLPLFFISSVSSPQLSITTLKLIYKSSILNSAYSNLYRNVHRRSMKIKSAAMFTKPDLL